ncbi:MAG: hypothetical protein WB624_27980 [Xanthobacteraceae bacterium]
MAKRVDELSTTDECVVKTTTDTQSIGLVVFVVTSAIIVLLWSNPQRAWIHPELAAIGRHVATAPHNLASIVALLLNWHHFADDPQRARYLSGFFEIIDAIARPYIARVFAHPSLSVTTIIYVTLIPLFLYRTLRLFLLSAQQSFLFCSLLVATPGFLSNLFAYFHPAKPLSFILLAASIYFATAYSLQNRIQDLVAIGVALFLGFFSDELLLWNLFFLPAYVALMGASARTLRRLCFVLIATVGFYAVTLLFIMPWLEREFGSPSGNLPRPHAVLLMIRYLFSGSYYFDAAWVTSRSVLASFGWATPSIVIASLAGFCVTACAAAIIAFSSWRRHHAWKLAAVSFFALCTFSPFGVWLLFYNGPPALLGYASLNYYYNSPISYLVVMCLASIFKTAEGILSIRGIRQYVTVTLAVVICPMIMSDVLMFSRLNYLVRFIHLGPTDTSVFFSVASNGFDYPYPPLKVVTGNKDLFGRLFARAKRDGLALFGRYSPIDLNAAYYDKSYYLGQMHWFGSSYAKFGYGYGTELCRAFFGNRPCPVIYQENSPSEELGRLSRK